MEEDLRSGPAASLNPQPSGVPELSREAAILSVREDMAGG